MGALVLLCGIPSEPPLRRVARACTAAGCPFVMLDQRRWDRYRMRVSVGDAGLGGELVVDGDPIPLDRFGGVYTRVTDWRILPDLEELPDDDQRVQACARLHHRLATWIENAPIRVVNRASAMASNGSKPYQAQVIAEAGFSIPTTLVTNEPDEARAFAAEHGRAIFKAISGERTIVTELGPEHDEAFARLPRCPTQFQRYVAGTDVRVHVVGEEIFATKVSSGSVDYRYDRRTGLEAIELSTDVARRCVELARWLELPLAGIDLRFGDDDRVYCFEANPSPAFSYYEEGTGQPIAAAIARYLARA